jgi:hypothetical protein
MTAFGFVLSVVAIPLVAWYATKRILQQLTLARDAEETAARTGRAAARERAEEEREKVVREAVLGLVLLSPFFYLFAMGVDDIGAATRAALEGGEMDIDIAMQALIGIGAFLVAYGLSAAILPQLFPYAQGTKRSLLLSEGTAVVFSAVFALYLGVDPARSQKVLDRVLVGFTGVLMAFIGILFTALGAYLLWT